MVNVDETTGKIWNRLKKIEKRVRILPTNRNATPCARHSGTDLATRAIKHLRCSDCTGWSTAKTTQNDDVARRGVKNCVAKFHGGEFAVWARLGLIYCQPSMVTFLTVHLVLLVGQAGSAKSASDSMGRPNGVSDQSGSHRTIGHRGPLVNTAGTMRQCNLWYMDHKLAKHSTCEKAQHAQQTKQEIYQITLQRDNALWDDNACNTMRSWIWIWNHLTVTYVFSNRMSDFVYNDNLKYHPISKFKIRIIAGGRVASMI